MNLRRGIRSKRASIWKLQAIQISDEVMVNGVLLSGYPEIIHENESVLSTFYKIVRSYFARPLRQTDIMVRINDASISVTTDAHGEFSFQTHTRHVDYMTFTRADTHVAIPVRQAYPILFKKSDASFLLVSDIDDTIMISKSSRFLSKLWLMLLRPSPRRKAVLQTQKAFRALENEHVQFSYVSASESNLFYLITAFFKHNDLPLGPIFLRPHTYWPHLFKPRETESYKFERINSLIGYFPDKEIILFGDDSQYDLQAFTAIAQLHAKKVRCIFLHKTGLTSRYETLAFESQLPESGVRLYYYEHYDEIALPIQYILNEVAVRS